MIMKKTLFGISIIALGLASCDKKSALPDRFTIIPETNTNIKFMQLSPDAPTVNFFVNSGKISGAAPTATNAVTGMAFGGFFPANVGYVSLPSGSLKIDAKVPDSSLVMPGALLLSNTQTFDAKKSYTFVLMDSLSKLTSVIIEDDLSVPDLTKAYFRVANFIHNGPVKVEITKTSSDYAMAPKSFASIASKTALPFDSLGASAGQVYKILMRHPVTDARLDSIVGFTPGAGKKYTFYARGVIGQSGSTNTRRPLIFSMTNL
jgi:hypothetical protein